MTHYGIITSVPTRNNQGTDRPWHWAKGLALVNPKGGCYANEETNTPLGDGI
jgi:hypothetical protein